MTQRILAQRGRPITEENKPHRQLDEMINRRWSLDPPRSSVEFRVGHVWA